MKKDIDFPKVKDVAIAIVKRPSDEWMVYLINQNSVALENVLVCSKGYGILDGEKRQSSTLRHGIPLVEANHTALIEPISPEVFQLTNEYWVSYYIGNQIFDKKYVFVPDSIVDDNLTTIPLLNEKGIFHK